MLLTGKKRSEQGQPEVLLLPTGAAARLQMEWLQKVMSRRISGYRIVWL
jgi:hypothetical protein